MVFPSSALLILSLFVSSFSFLLLIILLSVAL
jgi:hypothetical protein